MSVVSTAVRMAASLVACVGAALDGRCFFDALDFLAMGVFSLQTQRVSVRFVKCAFRFLLALV